MVWTLSDLLEEDLCVEAPRWVKELPSTRDAETGVSEAAGCLGWSSQERTGWVTLRVKACLERILPWENEQELREEGEKMEQRTLDNAEGQSLVGNPWKSSLRRVSGRRPNEPRTGASKTSKMETSLCRV